MYQNIRWRKPKISQSWWNPSYWKTVPWAVGLGYTNNFTKSRGFSSLKHSPKRLGNLKVSWCSDFHLLELPLPPEYPRIPNSVYSKDSNKSVMGGGGWGGAKVGRMLLLCMFSCPSRKVFFYYNWYSNSSHSLTHHVQITLRLFSSVYSWNKSRIISFTYFFLFP